MKYILALILSATIAAGQSTGDYLLQRKTSSGYAAKSITPENGKSIGWDSSGNPVNIAPVTSLAWDAISSKPSTFAPSSHTHPLSELSQSGATTGQVATWDGSDWTPENLSALEFTPLELSPVAWWDGTDSANVLKTISGSVPAAVGETVERWTDKIGGLNLDQTTAGQRRTLASDGSLIPNDTGGCSFTGSIPISHASMSIVFIHGKRTTTKQQPGYLWLNGGFTSGVSLERMGGTIYGPTTTGVIGAYDDSGSLLAFCYGASSSVIYNQYKAVSLAARTAGSQTITRLFDYDTSAVPHRLPIRHILLFDRQLTSSEIELLRTWADMPEKEVVVSAFGDSIINGASPTAFPQAFVRQLAQAKGWTIANGAIDGTQLSYITGTAAAVLNASYTSGKTNRLILHVGCNDMAANVDPATFLTSLASFYSARKSHAADWDVAVCTIPPRNNTFTNGQDAAGYAADRTTINDALQAAAPGTYFDRLIDFDSDAILGADATANSTTWYNADKIHPNTNGHNRMAVIASGAYP